MSADIQDDGFPPVTFTHYPMNGQEVIVRQMVAFGMDDVKILVETGDDGPEVTLSVTEVDEGASWQVGLAVTLAFISAAALQGDHPAIADKLIDVLADLNEILPDEELAGQ